MYHRHLASVAFLFLAGVTLKGEAIHSINLDEGINRVSEDAEGFTNVTRTDDGFVFEIFTKQHEDRLDVGTDFRGELDDSWYRFTIDRMEFNGNSIELPLPTPRPQAATDFFRSSQIIFDPWESPFGNPIAKSPQSFVFQPTGIYPLFFEGPFCPECVEISEEGNSIVFEYSVEEICPPLPADFNYDDKVDFPDFLILLQDFGFDAPNEPNHYRGDANLDGFTDFEDFLILSESFGTSREAQGAAAVPEPMGATLLALVLVCLAGLRRRRV